MHTRIGKTVRTIPYSAHFCCCHAVCSMSFHKCGANERTNDWPNKYSLEKIVIVVEKMTKKITMAKNRFPCKSIASHNFLWCAFYSPILLNSICIETQLKMSIGRICILMPNLWYCIHLLQFFAFLLLLLLVLNSLLCRVGNFECVNFYEWNIIAWRQLHVISSHVFVCMWRVRV